MAIVSAPKCDIDTVLKRISITSAPALENGDQVVDFDIQIDLYSDLKEVWQGNEALRKLRFPVRTVGGDPLPGSKQLGDTYFLAADWKISPYEANHRFRVNGNFFSEDGASPFVPTSGAFNVFMEHQVSSLVDSTIQQLPEIEYASFGGGVTLDVTSPYAGTDYPIGTQREPVNNLDDAMSIAVARGFGTIYVIGDALIDSNGDYEGMIFIGESQTKSTLTISTGANVLNCEFYDAHVTGTLDGNAKLKSCLIDNLNYIHGYVEQCVLSPGTIVLGGNSTAHFLDCWSGVPGLSTPVIDMGGSGQALALRNYNGGIGLRNKSGTEAVSIDLNSGQVILDSTVTAGTVVVRGVGHLTDNSSGATVVDQLIDGEDTHSILAILKNKMVTDPSTGVLTLYDDDGVTPLMTANIYEDAAGTQLYRGQGVERREALT